ncbi:MAG: protein kinase [Sedimentisphaerales bacterium]
MQRYQYQHGDRPLEGYTIERAAGRGGFGEVYYAISDGGREVAIKAVQNYEQIELRGISQCMNLKSPHLVTIFDVKYNDQHEPFVIMEYVSGPSLRELLTESPHGLGAQKAAFFLREIAKSLSFLHECGIVHRDLKPGNIFYENGYVKVGDYGLAKAISASRHSGHTITVGTVSYMAPEIGAGSYNRSIDIYALGVLLYEMLTGDVPFIGSSPAEILMKHMTVAPELDNIDEPFRKVIKKALAKDPAERYQTVQEMVEDLFGSENIRDSVSQFSPNELSVIAERVAAKANIADTPRPPKPRAEVGAQTTRGVGKELTETAQRFARQADAMGRKVADRVDAEAQRLLGSRSRSRGFTDPVDPRQRRTLAILSMVLVAFGAAILSGSRGHFFQIGLTVFVMIAATSKTILSSRRRWFGNLEPESQWVPRVVTCCLAALVASLVGGILGVVAHGPYGDPSGGFRLWLSMAIPMLLVDWGRITSPQRSKRLSLGSALWLGMLGFIASAIFGQNGLIAASVLAGTSLVVQAYSSFGRAGQPEPAAKAQSKAAPPKKQERHLRSSVVGRPIPPYVRTLWLLGFFGALGLGMFLVIMAAMGLRGGDFALAMAFGVDSLIFSLFCFVGTFRHQFNGWYRYIIKPGILLACALTIVFSSICMGCLPHVPNDGFFILLMLIIFPAIAFFVVAALPARLFVGPVPRAPAAPPAPQASPGVSSYKRLWALLLAAVGGFGFPAGLHRFYVGKIGTGILWFLTFGLFGVGQVIDIIMIIVGQFRDRYGLPLEVWLDEDELTHATVVGDKPVDSPPGRRDEEPAAAQAAEKQEVRAAEKPPAPPAPSAPTTTVVYEPFRPVAFLFSGAGFVLLFAAILVGLAVGLHAPYLVAAGNSDLARELDQTFGYSEWPSLFMRLGMIITAALLLIASVFIVIGRRHSGARHLIRGVLGLAGLLGALMWLSDGISSGFRYGRSAFDSGQIGPVLDRILQSCQSEEVAFAGVVFLVSVVVLAWPAHPKQVALTPALGQGVS